MKLTRRSLLSSGAIAAAAMAVASGSAGSTKQQIVIFDSRIAPLQLSGSAKNALHIDVAQPPVLLWKQLQDVSGGATVVALTRWSDFIAIRGQLESAGLRLQYAKQRGEIMEWQMG